MKSVCGLTAIFAAFLLFNVAFADEMRIIEENVEAEFKVENIDGTRGDIDRIWGSINEDSVRIDSSIGFLRNVTIGIAVWNVTVRYSRTIDGIRLRSVDNTGAFGDIIDGGVGFNFASFLLVGHSHHFHFIADAYENYTSSLVTPPTTTLIPNLIVREWGTINSISQTLFPVTRFQVIAEYGIIINEIIRVNASGIIDGVRLTSLENSVASGEIIEGGIGFNYVILNVTSKQNFLSCQINNFINGTEIVTTPYPDLEVEHWGTVHSHSVLLSNNRHAYYPESMLPADRRITENTERPIHAMRLFALNGTRGSFALIEGGLGHQFVTFRFIGESLGRGFDFRLELYNSAVSKGLSGLLVLLVSLLQEFANGQDYSQQIAPATIPVEWGNVNETRILAQQRFFYYPAPGVFATGNGSMSTSDIILGMRLIRMNGTDGLHTLMSGGVNHQFVTFDFMGVGLGRAYDFNIELYGSAVPKRFSVVLVVLSSFVFCILNF